MRIDIEEKDGCPSITFVPKDTQEAVTAKWITTLMRSEKVVLDISREYAETKDDNGTSLARWWPL